MKKKYFMTSFEIYENYFVSAIAELLTERNFAYDSIRIDPYIKKKVLQFNFLVLRKNNFTTFLLDF